METAFGRGVERERGGNPSSAKEETGEKEEEEEERRRRRISPSAVAAEGVGDGDAAVAAVGRVDKFEELDGGGSGAGRRGSIDDVSKPMPRRGAEPGSLVPGEGKRGEAGRGSVGLSFSSILNSSKGPTLLGDSGEQFFLSGVMGKGEDTPDGGHREGWR